MQKSRNIAEIKQQDLTFSLIENTIFAQIEFPLSPFGESARIGYIYCESLFHSVSTIHGFINKYLILFLQ